MFAKISFRKTSLMLLLLAGLCLALAGPAPAGGHGKKKPAKTAILLVTFGTSVPRAQGVFKAIDQAYAKAFPGLERRWAYTAAFIRKKVAKQGLKWDSPEEALAGLMAAGYNRVAVQSLHVIPGAEFHDLVAIVRGFNSMSQGFKAVLGAPLCATTGDLQKVAAALLAALPKARQKSEAVAFMGHGTHHPAGVVYPAMAYLLGQADPLVLMGTVEGFPALDDVKKALAAKKVKKVWLLPFMTVAGDHAMNDMAGPEPDSWKSVLEKAGFKIMPVLKSIAENPAVMQVWISHSKAALKHLKLVIPRGLPRGGDGQLPY